MEDPTQHPDNLDDLAPDHDEPGDEFPAELEDLVHEGDIVPDNVDLAEEVDDA
jgi:hypothetical protein